MTTETQLEDIYPLSSMQEGILLNVRRFPDSGVYSIQLAAEIKGNLDVAMFKHAWDLVVLRHSALRTCFEWDGLDRPLQLVDGNVIVPWIEHDWRQYPRETSRQLFNDYLALDREKRFDLRHAPLMRMGLMRIDQETHYFVWTYHHLILDGWSVSNVLSELGEIYKAYRNGIKVELREPRPFSQYIAWLQNQNVDKARAFWQRLFEDFHVDTRADLRSLSALGSPLYRHDAIKVSADSRRALKELS